MTHIEDAKDKSKTKPKKTTTLTSNARDVACTERLSNLMCFKEKVFVNDFKIQINAVPRPYLSQTSYLV